MRVKDAIDAVSDLLGQMLAAIRGANALTLLTGVLVLAGALAAGLSGRIYDAVVLKTYGATRRQLMRAFVTEYASLGLAAAVFGVLAGSLGSWFLAHWILEMPWSFSICHGPPDRPHRHVAHRSWRPHGDLARPLGQAFHASEKRVAPYPSLV